MKVDSIQNGIVIDHITAGKGMELYKLLGLAELGVSVALMMNAVSEKMGRKDIIKIDAEIDIDMDVLGFIDPDITINVIKNEQLVEKRRINLPEKLTNVVFCKNPRCIVTTEQELPHIFRLTDPSRRVYRCIYCDSEAKPYVR